MSEQTREMIWRKRYEIAEKLFHQYPVSEKQALEIVDSVMQNWALSFDGAGNLYDDLRKTVDRYRQENHRLEEELVERDTTIADLRNEIVAKSNFMARFRTDTRNLIETMESRVEKLASGKNKDIEREELPPYVGQSGE